MIERTRQNILRIAFEMLYSRFACMHEATGTAIYGAAWNGRRRHAIPAEVIGPLLDLGCGEGRLLAAIGARSQLTIGIEPSAMMSRRADRRGVLTIRASAQSLPLRAGSIRHVTATYPGPWILDSLSWAEIGRVTTPGATVQILLGGGVTRGRGACVRRLLLRLAYGGEGTSVERLPALGSDLVIGDYDVIDDGWGQAIVWSGIRQARAHR